MKLTTLYGHLVVENPVIKHILQLPALERLKKISQSGVASYVIPQVKTWSRYDHSLGVLFLLQRYGASLEEQLAGLLHDVSHTAFSHVADFVFEHTSQLDSYQDSIHEWFLRSCAIDKELALFSISLDEVLHKSGGHKALEQDLPYLCADRLDYNLMGGALFGRITPQEIQELLLHLKFEQDAWFFIDQKRAKRFALIVLENDLHIWGTAWNGILYELAAQALRRAIELKLVSQQELHFSTDEVLWNRLLASNDSVIKDLLHKFFHYQDSYKLVEEGVHDFAFRPKFRGIDPFVKTSSGLVHLSSLDQQFADEYQRVRDLIKRGWFVKLQA